MRRAAAAIAIALITAASARATTLSSCCACRAIDTTQTLVLFCAEASLDDIPGLEKLCNVTPPGGALSCETNIPGPSCSQQLAASGIICPTAGAPAAAPVALLMLAVALGGLGVVILHRRRSA